MNEYEKFDAECERIKKEKQYFHKRIYPVSQKQKIIEQNN